ncbi:tryptophan transporter [Lentibacillus halodurans]
MRRGKNEYEDFSPLSLFLGIGAVLHFIIPPFIYGMKPDICSP